MDRNQIRQAASFWRQGYDTTAIALRVFGTLRRWEREGFAPPREVNTEAEVYNHIEQIKARGTLRST
jgi:hypothetical protein